jgi:hypothetical protein
MPLSTRVCVTRFCLSTPPANTDQTWTLTRRHHLLPRGPAVERSSRRSGRTRLFSPSTRIARARRTERVVLSHMLISGFQGVHGVGSVGTRGYLCKPTYRHEASLWSKSQVADHVFIQPSFVMCSSLIACLQYGKPSRQMQSDTGRWVNIHSNAQLKVTRWTWYAEMSQ